MPRRKNGEEGSEKGDQESSKEGDEEEGREEEGREEEGREEKGRKEGRRQEGREEALSSSDFEKKGATVSSPFFLYAHSTPSSGVTPSHTRPT